jgi:adenine-specific DNA-methyltransferase
MRQGNDRRPSRRSILASIQNGKSSSFKRYDASDSKTRYAQYFTPVPVAEFMVRMFADEDQGQPTVLDPGAGEGVLGLSLARHLSSKGKHADVLMVEIDGQVFQTLEANAAETEGFTFELFNGDFLREGLYLFQDGRRFTHVIMNPPYFKLQRSSEASEYLMTCGISVTNIYAAFMWLGLMLLADKGQMVAIIPRSFCNGPYFRKFRKYVADSASIEAIHTFKARDKVFSSDKVLQENVIIRFSKQTQSNSVTVSYSSDQGFADFHETVFPASEVLDRDDVNLTIHIPSSQNTVRIRDYARHSLAGIGLDVSTGPIVDFRHEESITQTEGDCSVPLLYPAHMKDGRIIWPLDSLPKRGQYYSVQPDLWSNADVSMSGGRDISPSDGYYVVVRRFSSKEERRRIYAAVVDPLLHPGGFAFENHLNYFHMSKHGFDKELAFGLSAYLNSALLDGYFRSLSGHTQVNATDLRALPYPSTGQLRDLGRIVLEEPGPIETVVTEETLMEWA